MASLSELAAKIEADRAGAEELGGVLNASKEQAEQVAAAIGGLAIERAATRMRSAAAKIEEAESIRAALQGSLVKAHFQVMSAIHGRIGPGAPGSGAIVPLTRVDSQTGAPKAGLDAIPPHIRQGPTPTGDELTGVDPSFSPFQKEHENANADLKMNRLSRLGRKAVQGAGDLQAAGRDLTTSTKNTAKGFDPSDPGTYPTATEVPSHTSQIHSPTAGQPDPTNVVGTAIVMAAVVVEGIGRIIERRRSRHGE